MLQQSDYFITISAFGKKGLVSPLEYSIPVAIIGREMSFVHILRYIEAFSSLAYPETRFLAAVDHYDKSIESSYGCRHLHIDLYNSLNIDSRKRESPGWMVSLMNFWLSVDEKEACAKGSKQSPLFFKWHMLQKIIIFIENCVDNRKSKSMDAVK